MSDHPSRRFRRPSLRALLALGGAAAVVVSGAIATTDTLAASTDEANAQVSQIATQNFFPTPLTANVTCTTNPNGSNVVARRAQISWTAVPGATGYRLELVSRSNGSVKQARDVGAETTTVGGLADSGREGLYARVYTKNNEAMSSGYTVSNVGMSFKDYISSRTECEGGTGTNQPNATWENQTAWTPGAPTTLAQRQAASRGVIENLSDAEETPATSESPSSEAPAPSTEPSTEAEPSEETTPSSTEQPAPSSTEPAEDDAEVTIGIGVAGDKKALIVSRDGEEVCHTPLEPGDQPSINGNTVVIQSGDTVKSVDTTTCAVS